MPKMYQKRPKVSLYKKKYPFVWLNKVADLGATPTPPALCEIYFWQKISGTLGSTPHPLRGKIVFDTLPFMHKIPPQVSEGSQPTPVPTISEQSDHLSPVSPLLEVALTVVQVEN